MKEYKLYKHTNIVNGKIYIGITNNIKRRWRNKGIEYKPERGRQSAFWNAIQKYGWESFEHKIILDHLSFEEACVLEKTYISKFHANSRQFGYNIASGGNGGHVYLKHPKGMLGKRQSDYHIKVHRALLANPSTNPMKNGDVVWGKTHEHPRGMRGHHQSTYHKKIMASQRGSKNPNAKLLIITFPNGNQEIWPTTKQFIQSRGFYKAYELIKTKKPYFVDLKRIRKSQRKICGHYLGCTFSH